MRYALCVVGAMEKIRHIWPTTADLARDLGLPYPTVGSWARRGIPAGRVPEIVRAARAKGHDLTFEALLGDDEAAA